VTDEWFAAWREAARILGLSLDGLPRSWTSRPRLSGRVDGVDVTCGLGIMGARVEPDAVGITWIRAPSLATPPKLRLLVSRGYLYPLGRAFFQDIRTGDASFDDRFIVKGSNEELVRLWLSAPVRESMGGAEDWAFALRGGTVSASLGKQESSAPILVSAIRAVVGLARRGQAFADELDALAVGLGGQREPGPWNGERGPPIELDAEGTRVTIEHRHARFGNRWRSPTVLYTRIACRRVEVSTRRFLLVRRRLEGTFGGAGRKVALSDPALEEKYLARAEDADHLRAHLTPEVRALIARSLPDAILVDEDVGIWTFGLQIAPATVAPLVELAAALAPERQAVGSGPYR
jgi:hypothetical protein